MLLICKNSIRVYRELIVPLRVITIVINLPFHKCDNLFRRNMSEYEQVIRRGYRYQFGKGQNHYGAGIVLPEL